MPVFPGARQVGETGAEEERSTDLPLAPIAGYRSLRSCELPAGTTPQAVIDFYSERLRETGWTVVQKSEAPSLSVSRHTAYVHVLADPSRLYIGADHDFCTREPEFCRPTLQR